MSDVVWSVIALLTIGLLGTIWWIYVILELAHREINVPIQNKEDQEDS